MYCCKVMIPGGREAAADYFSISPYRNVQGYAGRCVTNYWLPAAFLPALGALTGAYATYRFRPELTNALAGSSDFGNSLPFEAVIVAAFAIGWFMGVKLFFAWRHHQWRTDRHEWHPRR